MQIDIKEICNSKRVGDIVWICHYHRPDIDKKPLRCVPPTRVQIMSNESLPKNKKVYYSETHFAPLKSDGTPYKKVIAPFDNTGYRSYTGSPVYVFDSESECINVWNIQILECVDKFDHKISKIVGELRTERDKLNDKIIKV
jgi:hypothetical protein